MIESLRIRDLAVVADTELELGPGLNVLTGETGTGKSLVLGALELLAGARAAADRVRTGAEHAVVEAVLRCPPGSPLAAALAERGLAAEDEALIARRQVPAGGRTGGGRSRAWLAGQLVPVSLLGEILGERIEISSQHESQGLRRPETHALLLDTYGGLLDVRAAVALAHGRARALDAEIAALRGQAEERERRRDYLAFQVREIDEARLQPDELRSLEAERARLLHAERLGADAARAAAALSGDPAAADAPAALDLLAAAARRIEELTALDASLGPLGERLAGAHAELADVAADLEAYASRIEADPGRLAELEERLDRLERLRRKYGPDVDAILAFRERAAAELAESQGADARLAACEAERAEAAARLAEDAGRLSRGRRKAARRLGEALTAALVDLALPHAALEMELAPLAAEPGGLACGPGGGEAPQFVFRANPGEPVRPLRRVASGGELSRVFLAVKNVLRKDDAGLVLVFDEVDAGVGGAVAERVGRSLAELAEQHQVLCITHLPQIAALADTHFRVTKSAAGGRTSARVERLEGDARVDEIARMAGGARIAEATRRHARALLGPRARP